MRGRRWSISLVAVVAVSLVAVAACGGGPTRPNEMAALIAEVLAEIGAGS